MIRTLVRAVIANATVTRVDSDAPVALRLDPIILRAAEILPMEVVEVIDVATGERFRTWVEAGTAATGEVRLHAGVRHPIRTGDIVSIIATGLLHDGQTLNHHARVVTLSPSNEVVSVTER